MNESIGTVEYMVWLESLKSKINSAKSKVAVSVNSQLIELYCDIAKEISKKASISNWGASIIEQISLDLRNDFPDMKGFSRRNLYAIKQWFEFYNRDFEFVAQTVAQIPWGHNRLIISKLKSIPDALFYCEQVAKNGWSRDFLESEISKKAHLRNSISTNNFSKTLPANQRKLASEILKDPYNFNFLSIHDQAVEREIETELINNITEFLLELWRGFAYVGKQYKIEISETDYFIDLLFYHLELRCYIVIELKAGKFKPEYAGKLNFYLSAIDSQIKKESDSPSIGIVLCKKKDKIEAEYSLRDINKPMGISEYLITQSIPDEIKTKLPSIEELEIDLSRKMKNNNT